MCRYPVRGLPTFRCPECGNDLRKVGITATGVRSHTTPWQRVGYWTLLFLVAAIPLTALADNLLRWRQGSTSIAMLTSDGSGEVTLTVHESGYGGPFRRRNIQLAYWTNRSGSFLVDVNGRTLNYETAGGGAPAAKGVLTESAIEQWFRRSGNVSPNVALESLDLLAMVKAAIADGDLRHRPPVYFEQRNFRYTGTGSGSSAGMILAALVILWMTGALIVWRRSPHR
jgi:hypothetical protein